MGGSVSYNTDSVGGRYKKGTKAVSECGNGYSIFRGWRTRTCQSNGLWDGWPTECERGKFPSQKYT